MFILLSCLTFDYRLCPVFLCLVSKCASASSFSISLAKLNTFVDHKQAANIEPEASGIHDGEYQLTKHEISCLAREKCSGIPSSFCLPLPLPFTDAVDFALYI